MFGGMNGRQRKDWRETEPVEDAVRRLIGVMDERARKKASGAQSPEQIADEIDGWRGSGPVETRFDFPMRPPAQPCAGSDGERFTVEAEARNARTDKSD